MATKIASAKSPSPDGARSPSNLRERIIHYIRAGYAGLYLVSAEEQRVQAEIKAVADALKYRLFFWSAVDGLADTGNKSVTDANEIEVLAKIEEMPEDSMVVLLDYHLFLADQPNPILLRKFKDALNSGKSKGRHLIVLGCRLCLPPELEREMTVLEFGLPGREALDTVLSGVLESAKLEALEGEAREWVIDAACGLTAIEAENAFALSVAKVKQIVPAIVASEKAQSVKKSGLLELIETSETLDDIGGLDLLKAWLLQRRDAFSKRALAYGLPIPKGLLIMGIPGTGKSLTAKATARVFDMPLLKLDAGRIFAGLVGQSESNLRSVIQTAEAIAPVVLWIEELEKGFAGSKSSGATDGGTSARVFGSFISWMQEKKSPVFIVATANDVSQLPPEMLRKGRFDELFFVDLPSPAEREAIWAIQIAKYRRDPKDFDAVQLARATEGFTGSEIENAFVDALFKAFASNQEPTDFTVAQILTDFVPLSKLMADQIAGLRNWAKGRARPAASTSEPERKLRKFAA